MEKSFYVGSMSQEQFFVHINSWFAANRNIKVTKIYTDKNTVRPATENYKYGLAIY